MGHIGILEIVILILIFVLLFGAKKIPQIGNAIGKALREFKKASKDDENTKS
ncbi:MAG: sec-independent protein translocase protein TatA [Lysobacterales bacterium]|jgi:sec-independent protein translocase protein TatA